MLRKQLITLAAILGILSCGACFLPNLVDRDPPPPPPPLTIDLRGVRMIGVTVSDDSKAPLLDPVMLAQRVAEYGNFRSRDTKVKLRVHREGGTEDAQLKIAILKESAVKLPQATPEAAQRWALQLIISSTLTARDGRVIWQETSRNRDLAPAITAADEAEFLQRLSHLWIYGAVSYPLVKSMFYGESR
jgi:hypothetical protein